MRRFAILLLFIACPSTVAAQGVDWPYYGGDQGGIKYSPLDQIDRDNVTELEVLWTWDNGEEPITGASVPVRGETIRPGRFEGRPVRPSWPWASTWPAVRGH